MMIARKNQALTAKERLQRHRVAAQENGRQGGFKRAEYYDTEILSEWTAKRGRAMLAKYGRGYFVELRKRRRNRRTDEIAREGRDAYEASMAALRLMRIRRNGQKGGLARAALYSVRRRSEWARQGGMATRGRHGKYYYSEIRKLRKRYRKGYVTRKTKERLIESFKCETSKETQENPGIVSLSNFMLQRNTLTYVRGWAQLRSRGRNTASTRIEPGM